MTYFNNSSGEAYLIGWEWDSEMVKCSTKDFGYGIVSHYVAAKELREIKGFEGLMAFIRMDKGKL